MHPISNVIKSYSKPLSFDALFWGGSGCSLSLWQLGFVLGFRIGLWVLGCRMVQTTAEGVLEVSVAQARPWESCDQDLS